MGNKTFEDIPLARAGEPEAKLCTNLGRLLEDLLVFLVLIGGVFGLLFLPIFYNNYN